MASYSDFLKEPPAVTDGERRRFWASLSPKLLGQAVAEKASSAAGEPWLRTLFDMGGFSWPDTQENAVSLLTNCMTVGGGLFPLQIFASGVLNNVFYDESPHATDYIEHALWSLDIDNDTASLVQDLVSHLCSNPGRSMLQDLIGKLPAGASQALSSRVDACMASMMAVTGAMGRVDLMQTIDSAFPSAKRSTVELSFGVLNKIVSNNSSAGKAKKLTPYGACVLFSQPEAMNFLSDGAQKDQVTLPIFLAFKPGSDNDPKTAFDLHTDVDPLNVTPQVYALSLEQTAKAFEHALGPESAKQLKDKHSHFFFEALSKVGPTALTPHFDALLDLPWLIDRPAKLAPLAFRGNWPSALQTAIDRLGSDDSMNSKWRLDDATSSLGLDSRSTEDQDLAVSIGISHMGERGLLKNALKADMVTRVADGAGVVNPHHRIVHRIANTGCTRSLVALVQAGVDFNVPVIDDEMTPLETVRCVSQNNGNPQLLAAVQSAMARQEVNALMDGLQHQPDTTLRP